MSYSVAGSGLARVDTSLRRIVDDRLVAHGGWCMIPGAFPAEIVSASGCDWLGIDQQHGLIDDSEMRVIVVAAAIRHTPILVRVPSHDPAVIMRALDAGADGIIVPMVNTADEAERVVTAARYPPRGSRSWGPVRSTMAQPGYTPRLGNQQVVCLAMVETVEAFANLDDIISVEGLDGVYVGPSDLAISHADTPEAAGASERDVAMIRDIARACHARGLVAGIACADGAEARRWQAAGYTLFSLASDAALLGAGMADALADARDGHRGAVAMTGGESEPGARP